MAIQGRKFSSNSYKYGFNGQLKDDEIYGSGNLNSAEFWEYDTRLGRRWNLDPIDQISESNYSCFRNNPIFNIDIKGDKADGIFDEQKDGSWKKREGVKNDGGKENDTFVHLNGDVKYVSYNNGKAQIVTVKAGDVAEKRKNYRDKMVKLNKGAEKAGNLINDVGDGIATVGYLAAPFTEGASLGIAAVGEGISSAGKIISNTAKVNREGLTENNTTDIVIDAAFELIPKPIEKVIEKTKLDDVAKKIVKAQVGKLKMGTEKAVEVARKDKVE